MSVVIVPNLIGLTLSEAQSALSAAGFVLGTETPALNPNVSVGDVAFQSPDAYAQVDNVTITNVPLLDSYGNQVYDSYGNAIYTQSPSATVVDVGISAIAVTPNLNLTAISQYAQSPVVMQLIQNASQYFDQSANWNNFYLYVWNIASAQGFGLDFWGKVLGVSRYLQIPAAADYLGFQGAAGTASGYAFNVGVFFDGATATETYSLNDADYLTLLYAKAFANIMRCCIPALNQLLMTLFAGYGDAYVIDNGNMSMTFYLGWSPTAIQLAILEQSGVVPHPTGVAVSVSHL
jgi:hypothetical protein